MNRFKKFIFNGLLITAVSILIRSVAVSFNVYISNKIGAVAMGVFTLITTVYGFAVTVATSGISLASTRLIAEALGEQSDTSSVKTYKIRCIVKKCVTYALCFSIGAAIILYVFAPAIGVKLLLDERTVRPLRILAFSLPPIALSSVLGGYFTAIRRVYKNAIVTVLGQGLRIFVCIFLFSVLGTSDVESACIAIVLGGTASEIISLAVQYLLYVIEKKNTNGKKVTSSEAGRIWKNILNTALPVAFSAYMRSGLITIEHMLIPWGLQRSGSSRDMSLAAYGIVQSMVFPLVLFPSALSGSFAGLLVPEVAESAAVGDTDRIHRIINRVFRSVLIYAIGTAGIMTVFSHELANTVYPHTDSARFILMISPLIPVMYLDTSVDGILKGLGEQVYCMGVNIADALLSVILVWILLPRMGINGYIITVYFTEIVNAALSIARLLKVTKIKLKIFDIVVKPLACIIFSIAVTKFFGKCIVGSMISAPILTSYIAMSVGIYLILLVLTKTFRFSEKERVLKDKRTPAQ
ncbi:MAG: hypothetical protein E7607_04150 [Ruminococcaceae bacterium]|nr:hypothetical protein [Oscillospiraceae bacterium]